LACLLDNLLAASWLSVEGTVLDGRSSDLFFFLILFIIILALVSARWDPKTWFPVERSILACQVMALGISCNVIAAALRKSASTCRELGADSCIGCNPVGKGILAILNNSFWCLISIICSASLARSNWGIINQLQEMLPVTSDNGELLAVLTEGVELVGIGSL
jgi:hypothetical protein